MGTEAPTTVVLPVRCAPKKAPGPLCGTPGRRKRTLTRRVRPLASKAVAHLEVTDGEYAARCDRCTTFRNSPEGVLPKAHSDNKVRDLIRDRLLTDGMTSERALGSIRRESLLDLSTGFVSDVLRDHAAHLDLATHRRKVLDQFSGTLRADGLHPGRFTLLLATDPLRDLPVAFALVSSNDPGHMRRFLTNLTSRGLRPRVVVTDGSNLDPAVLAELWPDAGHQLGAFHIVKEINRLILDAVRRLRTALSRRGQAGRKRKRGRQSKAAKAAAARRGPPVKEEASFVFQHRSLIVRRREDLTPAERDDLVRMLEYLPGLAALRRFADRTSWVFAASKDGHQASCRRAAVAREPAVRAVPELVKALEHLDGEKFPEVMAYLKDPVGRRVRTNDPVERTNRLFRSLEEVRYKWRRRRALVRFAVLRLDPVWSHWTPPEARTREPKKRVSSRKTQPEAGQTSRRVA